MRWLLVVAVKGSTFWLLMLTGRSLKRLRPGTGWAQIGGAAVRLLVIGLLGKHDAHSVKFHKKSSLAWELSHLRFTYTVRTQAVINRR